MIIALNEINGSKTEVDGYVLENAMNVRRTAARRFRALRSLMNAFSGLAARAQ